MSINNMAPRAVNAFSIKLKSSGFLFPYMHIKLAVFLSVLSVQLFMKALHYQLNSTLSSFTAQLNIHFSYACQKELAKSS